MNEIDWRLIENHCMNDDWLTELIVMKLVSVMTLAVFFSLPIRTINLRFFTSQTQISGFLLPRFL